MKTITLSKSGCQKLDKSEYRLYKEDAKELPKSFIPGEWIQCLDENKGDHFIGFINLHVKSPWQPINIVKKLETPLPPLDNEAEIAQSWIEILINRAVQRRRDFERYNDQGRLVFGENDYLPGLIIDEYVNCILVQINTAGIDRFREHVRSIISKEIPDKEVIILDNEERRSIECLPVYNAKEGTEMVHIKENDFKLSISFKKIQKVGYYYDHGINREKFEGIISRYQREFDKGLDLFCYIGSWGLHLLRAGVKEVSFIDQGNFEEELDLNIRQNNFEGRGRFLRKDVFSYMDELIARNEKFDVITSDPPAFAKSAKGKAGALNGYLKLHQKLMRLIGDKGILAINSCTKYVDFFELDQSVQMAAKKEGRRPLLIDIGIQGLDHPMRSLNDSTHYLKYLAYVMEA